MSLAGDEGLSGNVGLRADTEGASRALNRMMPQQDIEKHMRKS
jgi:hypothetical protein